MVARVRNALEALVRQSDLDGDGVRAPMVTVLVNGDAAALEKVLASLEVGVPVVVLGGTGGAARDLAMWEEEEGVSSSDEPDELYEERCYALIGTHPPHSCLSRP